MCWLGLNGLKWSGRKFLLTSRTPTECSSPMGQFTNENTEVTEINNCFLVWKCIENYSSEPVNSEREPKVSVTQSGKNSADILNFHCV